jgi:hypothetical protein
MNELLKLFGLDIECDDKKIQEDFLISFHHRGHEVVNTFLSRMSSNIDNQKAVLLAAMSSENEKTKMTAVRCIKLEPEEVAQYLDENEKSPFNLELIRKLDPDNKEHHKIVVDFLARCSKKSREAIKNHFTFIAFWESKIEEETVPQ